MALNYICNIPFAIVDIVICVDSKFVLYALQNWDCKVRIVYEVKYLIHCIMYHMIQWIRYFKIYISRGIGVEFCWVPSHCGLYWNEMSYKLAKQGAMKNMPAIPCTKLSLSHHEIYSILDKAIC